MNQVSATAACCGEQASHEELLGRLDGVLEEYRGKPGALIPVLQIAQGIFGYLPEDVLKRVALKLGKSYSEVAGVVGFYSYFSTVPRGQAPRARLPRNGLLRARRQAGARGPEAGAGHRGRRHDRRRPVLPRGGPVLRRLRPGAHDHDRRGRAPAGEAAEAARDPRAVREREGAREGLEEGGCDGGREARGEEARGEEGHRQAGSAGKRTVARKPAPRGKPVRAAAKRGARR